ncbi:MAG: hypothetical protein AVDCRST_MAG40-2393, partial [uncultured Gemmatimonadaceae bacterium]
VAPHPLVVRHGGGPPLRGRGQPRVLPPRDDRAAEERRARGVRRTAGPDRHPGPRARPPLGAAAAVDTGGRGRLRARRRGGARAGAAARGPVGV